MIGKPVEDLSGSLSFTALSDVLQFLHTTAQTGELRIDSDSDRQTARIFFENGNAYHAEDDHTDGLDTLVEAISWVEGTFRFSVGGQTPKATIDVPLPTALVEAARMLDERRRVRAEREKEDAPQRLLTTFAESSNVFAAMLITRNGSVIASADAGDAIDTTALGGGLAELIETVDRLGDAQSCQPFGGLFVEFDRFQILGLPLASTVLVVVAPGSAQLGVIRHKMQHLADALADVLMD